MRRSRSPAAWLSCDTKSTESCGALAVRLSTANEQRVQRKEEPEFSFPSADRYSRLWNLISEVASLKPKR